MANTKVALQIRIRLGLEKMFDHATEDESDLLRFLLCTGVREQEAQFVCW